jgi:hypothetical protein
LTKVLRMPKLNKIWLKVKMLMKMLMIVKKTSILIPTKPSHLDFGKSTMTEDDMPMMMKLGYFGEAESKLVRFAGEEVVPKPEKDEVVFKSFFRARL